MKEKVFRVWPLILGLVAVFASCGKPGKSAPDVSQIALSVHVDRFDQEVFAIDTLRVEASLAALNKKYPDFYEIFVKNLIVTDPPQSPEATVRGFISFPAIQKLKDTCNIVYPNLDDVEQQLTQSMKYLKYYLPEKPTPKFLAFISEYANAVITYGDSSQTKFAIGLDMFLGKDYKIYESFLPNYVKRTQDKQHLVSKTMDALVQDLAPRPMGQRLLDQMIYNGRAIYLKKLLMPTTPDSILQEYTSKQMQWCMENEQNIWLHFIGENLLYSTDRDKIQKLVNPSPNSPNMPVEAPGRSGNFMGWKIVESFMKNNPQVTVAELIELKSAQYIMDKAKYKPNKK